LNCYRHNPDLKLKFLPNCFRYQPWHRAPDGPGVPVAYICLHSLHCLHLFALLAFACTTCIACICLHYLHLYALLAFACIVCTACTSPSGGWHQAGMGASLLLASMCPTPITDTRVTIVRVMTPTATIVRVITPTLPHLRDSS